MYTLYKLLTRTVFQLTDKSCWINVSGMSYSMCGGALLFNHQQQRRAGPTMQHADITPQQSVTQGQQSLIHPSQKTCCRGFPSKLGTLGSFAPYAFWCWFTPLGYTYAPLDGGVFFWGCVFVHPLHGCWATFLGCTSTPSYDVYLLHPWAIVYIYTLRTWRRARVWYLHAPATLLSWQWNRRLESIVTPSDFSLSETGSLINLPCSGWTLSNFGMILICKVFSLSVDEEIMTLALFVLIQYQSVTDRRADRHLCSSNTSACIVMLPCW